jgi:hypothetical protein
MATLTAEELKAEYVSAMGKELGEVFYDLSNDCVWLHLKWFEYNALFGTSESRVTLLNRVARGFFGVLYGSLWDDVLQHICRLLDEPERRGKKRLCLWRLPKLIKSVDVGRDVRKRLEIADRKSAFARDWRDRRIAHRDYLLALERGAAPLAPASRQQVKDAIRAIVAVLNAVEQHYRGMSTGYEYSGHLGDADALFLVLTDGLDARNRRFSLGME